MIPVLTPAYGLNTPEGIEMIETADGGMEIGMPDAQPMGEVAFEANLAEVLDEDELGNIASMILGKVEDDKSSRQEWMDTYVDGLELLGLKYETKTEPFPEENSSPNDKDSSSIFHFNLSIYDIY